MSDTNRREAKVDKILRKHPLSVKVNVKCEGEVKNKLLFQFLWHKHSVTVCYTYSTITIKNMYFVIMNIPVYIGGDI